MAAVSGVGTSYNLPNYHGELFTITPTDTPFLAAIGGINGAKVTHAIDFEWQTIDRRASTANNAVVEGADATTFGERSRANVFNTTEIHQSAISVSYTKLAATGQFSGMNISPEWDEFMADELTLQTQAELQSMAVDIELSFLTGAYSRPANNSTARTTKGIITAVTTNLLNKAAGALTAADLTTLLTTMYGNGAPLSQESTVITASAADMVKLVKLYAADATLAAPPRDRNIAGMNFRTISTQFGDFALMMNRRMPAGKIAVLDLAVCYPVFLEIPQKGLLFVEELARTGASRKFQLYGEVGLEYGPETYHGVISNYT